jgi:hypothetical protein
MGSRLCSIATTRRISSSETWSKKATAGASSTLKAAEVVRGLQLSLPNNGPSWPTAWGRSAPFGKERRLRLLCWVREIGPDPAAHGTHSLRRTEASLIYRRTKNLRAMQLLLRHTKLESTIRYLGIEVDDTLEMPEQTWAVRPSSYLAGGRDQSMPVSSSRPPRASARAAFPMPGSTRRWRQPPSCA